jgi:hypothetical protein
MADDVTDNMEACRYHFFRHRYCSVTFWEEERGNFDGDGLFHNSVMIGERCAATTIDKNSTINLISIEVVDKLHLAARASKVPYLLHSSYGTLLISHMSSSYFWRTYRGCSLWCISYATWLLSHILGYPWCHNYQVQPCHDVMKVSFKWNKKRRALLCATAEQFHENHLLRKERTKEFCLLPKHKVMMDGGIPIICHLDHSLLHNPSENESLILLVDVGDQRSLCVVND